MKKNTVNPVELKGQDQMNRIHELMGKISPSINESICNSVLEISHKGPDGKIYGIVRENHKYYIKTANPKNNLTVNDFKYLGGLQNKEEFCFESYAKATKQLKLKIMSLNEAYGIENNEDTNILMKETAFSYGFKTEEETAEMTEGNEFIEEDDSEEMVDKANDVANEKAFDSMEVDENQKSKMKKKIQEKFQLTEEEASYLVDEMLSCEGCSKSVKEGDDEEYGDEDYERASREQQYYGKSPEAGDLDEKKKA